MRCRFRMRSLHQPQIQSHLSARSIKQMWKKETLKCEGKKKRKEIKIFKCGELDDCCLQIFKFLTNEITNATTDILVTASHMDCCKEKFQENMLPKITMVQKEIKLCPSCPAEDNPNAVTTACNKPCTLWL